MGHLAGLQGQLTGSLTKIKVIYPELTPAEKSVADFIIHNPVSYTHLDVYKRQVELHTTKPRLLPQT